MASSRVRLIADADLPAIVAACQDPDIPRYTTVPDPYGEHHARAVAARSAAGLRRRARTRRR